jgi:FAD binding domain-containing protein/berberine-like enzyme
MVNYSRRPYLRKKSNSHAKKLQGVRNLALHTNMTQEVHASMFNRAIKNEASQDFKEHLHGELIGPGDEGYEHARRVWNGMIDKYPALIARCADVSDVVTAIRFARRRDLPVAVRGGGHSFSGNGTCDGGLVIDLSPMKRVQIDPMKRIAWVQVGLTLGELIRETQEFGLAIPVGTASDTGLSGLTLGGGMGWLMGKYGLTIDNLQSVEIVTADGCVLQANANEHADLFWAVRGGGGNFGIVTTFEFQLHPVGTLLAGIVSYPVDRAREVLHLYREFTHTAPDELTTGVALTSTPDGMPIVALGLCYCGPLEEGKQSIELIRKFGSPLTDLIRPMSYLEIISMLDATVPPGRCYYTKARSLKMPTDEVFETLMDYNSVRPSPWSQIVLQHVHGATSRVDPSQTAFALREEYHSLQITTSWDKRDQSQADTLIKWTRDFWTETEPFATSGTYINFQGSEEEGLAAVRASYGANYERLVRVKDTYDPTNVFHINHNIKPTKK